MIIDDEVVRHNLDDLLWSLITVFQVSEAILYLFIIVTWQMYGRIAQSVERSP